MPGTTPSGTVHPTFAGSADGFQPRQDRLQPRLGLFGGGEAVAVLLDDLDPERGRRSRRYRACGRSCRLSEAWAAISLASRPRSAGTSIRLWTSSASAAPPATKPTAPSDQSPRTSSAPLRRVLGDDTERWRAAGLRLLRAGLRDDQVRARARRHVELGPNGTAFGHRGDDQSDLGFSGRVGVGVGQVGPRLDDEQVRARPALEALSGPTVPR